MHAAPPRSTASTRIPSHCIARHSIPTARQTRHTPHNHGFQLRLHHAQLQRRCWRIALWHRRLKQQSTTVEAAVRRREHTFRQRRRWSLRRRQHYTSDGRRRRRSFWQRRLERRATEQLVWQRQRQRYLDAPAFRRRPLRRETSSAQWRRAEEPIRKRRIYPEAGGREPFWRSSTRSKRWGTEVWRRPFWKRCCRSEWYQHSAWWWIQLWAKEGRKSTCTNTRYYWCFIRLDAFWRHQRYIEPSTNIDDGHIRRQQPFWQQHIF